jgi:glutaredoxin
MSDKKTVTGYGSTAMKLVPILLVFLALPSMGGTLYRWTDAQGNVHFSDQAPPSGAKNAAEKSYKSGAKPAAGTQTISVTLYTTATCGAPCDNARAYLARRGVTYTSKDPATDVSANEALRANSGTARVPTLMIGSDKLEGFSEVSWGHALDQAGFPKADAAGNTP